MVPARFKNEEAITLLMLRVGTRGVVRVGAIGHRRLRSDNLEIIARGAREAFAFVRQHGEASADDLTCDMIILSSLAEGADRLLVREALDRTKHQFGKVSLEVVLPLQRADYVQDFEASGSRIEFQELIDEAVSITITEQTATREEAYDLAGRYITDHSDILIAIWDGRKAAGQGGTGDIVLYAEKVHRPLLWIDSESGALTVLNA